MPKDKQNNFSKQCFVCDSPIYEPNITYNKKINLPICQLCINTEAEKEAEKKALESLSEGFVCGCI